MVSDVLDGTYEKINDSNQQVVHKQQDNAGSSEL